MTLGSGVLAWPLPLAHPVHVRTRALSVTSARPTGKSEGNGKMHITLCDFIFPWESLSATQKKSLSQRYQMGCECKVSRARTWEDVET